jgi:hypothetical protein
MASEMTIAGPFDDQLATRLMHQRIAVFGQEVDEEIANRICAELLLLPRGAHGKCVTWLMRQPGHLQRLRDRDPRPSVGMPEYAPLEPTAAQRISTNG